MTGHPDKGNRRHPPGLCLNGSAPGWELTSLWLTEEAKPVRWVQSAGGNSGSGSPGLGEAVIEAQGLAGWPARMYKGNKDSWESQQVTCWGRGAWETAREHSEELERGT